MTTTKTTETGTCQICERTCKLPKGRISLHGYNRPGTGWINGRCPGSNELPYELSCEALARFIATVLVARRSFVVEALARHESPELTEVVVSERNPTHRGQSNLVTYRRGELTVNSWGCTVDMFAIVVKNRCEEYGHEIKSLDREINRQTARLR